MKIKSVKAVIAPKIIHPLAIKTEFIRLDSALKLSGIAGTGGQAKIIIQAGEVKVNGQMCDKRSRKLKNGDIFSFENQHFEVHTHEGE